MTESVIISALSPVLLILLQLLEVHSPHSVFASACYWHCSTESAQFWEIAINNTFSDRDVCSPFSLDITYLQKFSGPPRMVL